MYLTLHLCCLNNNQWESTIFTWLLLVFFFSFFLFFFYSLFFFFFLFENLIIHSYLRIDHIVVTTFECRKRDEERLIISYSVTHVKRYIMRLHNTLHGFKGKFLDISIQKFVENLIVTCVHNISIVGRIEDDGWCQYKNSE